MNQPMVTEQVLEDLPPEPEQHEAPPVVPQGEETAPEQILGTEGDAESLEGEKPSEEQIDPSEEIPAYEPNFKYNVQSKEYEFDERLRGIIKDKESEDYVRDLVTRSHGLDTYKTKLSERETAFSDMEGKYTQVQDTAQKYERGFERLEALKNSDLSSFAQAWGISDAQILGLAKSIVQQDDNPALKAQRQSQFESVVQGWQQQDQQSQADLQASQSAARMHDMEMDLAMSNSDVKDFETAYDAKRGESGAFRRLVNTYGSSQWNQGNQLTPKACVKAVMDEFRAFIPKEPQQPVPQAQPQGTANPKPLPNMGSGRTGSPVKKKMSWNDLKKQAGLA
jgi:hypothetical protein